MSVRRLLWEQSHNLVPAGWRLQRRWADVRCVAPDKFELRSPARERPPFIPPIVTPPPTDHQRRLAPIMPTERPEDMSERDWTILTGWMAGQTVAEVAKSVGVTRQGCYVILHRAEQLLMTLRHCDPSN